MTKASSSSWLIPFGLGATSALFLVWANQKLARKSVTNHSGKASSTSPSKESVTNEELMDSAELDHRMLRKAEAVIQWRTTRLVLVIERCTNDHNYSAILRTAEALGIQVVYMIDPPEVQDGEDDEDEKKANSQTHIKISRTPEEIKARNEHHLFARNAQEWLTVRDFSTAEECVAELRREGYQLWVTDLSQEAVSLNMTSPSIPEKVALVMGTEAVGCSQYMLDEADLRVYLPLRGFADSLNLSVATALILHHLFIMDPTLIGGITEAEKRALREEWYAKLCQQRLLTASQKKLRLKLQGAIKKCQAIFDRSQNSGQPLDAQQQKKLDQWDNHKKQLAGLDALIDPVKIKAACREWVDNPPTPLTDVRRADSHRVCYVGKNTRKHHEDHWKGMVATSDSSSVYGATASVFREKLKENK